MSARADAFAKCLGCSAAGALAIYIPIPQKLPDSAFGGYQAGADISMEDIEAYAAYPSEWFLDTEAAAAVPAKDKKHYIYPSGHYVPRDRLIEEHLGWLQEHLEN